MKVWGMIKSEDRIQEDVVIDSDTFFNALIAICDHFDLTKPIICEKHNNEVDAFRRTIFYADDFIESVSFDTLELEIIDKKKKA